jgi:hypothetical protein
LRGVDPATRNRIAAAAIVDVAAYQRGGQVHVPGKARCIVGTK